MTFEIYKLEWILSRHTFGNTTKSAVKEFMDIWSGHHYPCLNVALLLKMYNVLKTSGLCLCCAYCRQCAG